MGKTRLEAFSDCVISILITIMILDMKAPQSAEPASLMPVIPTFLSYVLSFLYLGIYWNNHHHMLHTCKKVTGGIMWANLHLLFWLSLVPFTTAWMGGNRFASLPLAVYGLNLLCAASAYWLLEQVIIRSHGPHSILKKAVGSDLKGKISPALYVAAIALSFFAPWAAGAIYVLVALIWVVPDRRIEKMVEN